MPQFIYKQKSRHSSETAPVVYETETDTQRRLDAALNAAKIVNQADEMCLKIDEILIET